MSLGRWRPGYGKAGEIALHVRDEGWNAGGAEAFDQPLQRYRFARTSRTCDQAVAIGSGELQLLGIGTPRAAANVN
jgi:hypothetical protein